MLLKLGLVASKMGITFTLQGQATLYVNRYMEHNNDSNIICNPSLYFVTSVRRREERGKLSEIRMGVLAEEKSPLNSRIYWEVH